MAEEKYILEENPIYKDNDIRKLQNTDEVNADTVINPLFLRILNNIKALFRLISNKVDKAAGKGLSTNDYTTTDKYKVTQLNLKKGSRSVGVGVAALLSETTGECNVCIGESAGANITTGSHNIALGTQALDSKATGSHNIALGKWSLVANTTGRENTALGWSTLLQNTEGSYNIALGGSSLATNTTGSENIALGRSTLSTNKTGYNNIAIGFEALYNNQTGYNNTAIGFKALYNNTTGSRNTALGYNAMGEGYLANISNSTVIGCQAVVTGSNQVQLGDFNTTVYTYGAVQNRSDARDKADIRDTVLGLDFIKALRPVDFKWDYRESYNEIVQVIEDVLDEDGYPEQTLIEKQLNHSSDGTKTRKRYHHGLIAQEVKQVIDATGIDFGGYQDHSIKGGKDVLSIGYSELIAPLIKAVQELSVKVANLQEQLDEIKQLKAGM